MAQYKVPQDVEADDKLLGPFNFRQFIYLLIVAALIALAWAIGQIFPLFAIIPVVPALFLLILALPLRKDQPMETYIAALISFYTKPNKRYWFPGQRESTIEITVPKVVEQNLTKDLTEEEASHRISFLADVVDSEGLSIKEGFVTPTSTPVRDDFVAETVSTPDIFENYHSEQLSTDLSTEADRYRAEVVQQMRAAIAANNSDKADIESTAEPAMPKFNSANLTQKAPLSSTSVVSPDITQATDAQAPEDPSLASSRAHDRLVELSKNDQFTIATIAKEAKRERIRNNHKDDEVYINLH
jgi:hypothetical protein